MKSILKTLLALMFAYTSFASANVDSNLTEAFALNRARIVKDPAYKIFIKLEKNKEAFTGEETLTFRLTEKADVWVDFKYGQVTKLVVNNKPVTPVEIKDFRIRLPAELLTVGQNETMIHYTQTYSKNGTGLYKFTDPEDKREYLYSMFEPYDANHMIPCFDQPDMKGTFNLSVVAPSDWVVISSGKEKLKATKGGVKYWSFEETPQISPYIFSLHAGPYKMWQSKAGEIPLRLFSRQSLAKYVRTQDWFLPTTHGFTYFEAFFNYPYPFKKYDQVIVPDFNFGAMENVAAVTFAERYVQRGVPTVLERERLASTILHELAHMWFGNLVTMRWWNGLWLNESFATYLANLAIVEMKDFSYAWQTFNNGTKSWAYWEDQLVTTHPIEGQVVDTLSAFVNFDGITYGKGASVLKQLHYYLGDEAFKNGLRVYFKAHEFGNTEIKDFIGALASASRIDLREWAQLWLERAGLDSVKADYECLQGRLQKFQLVKTPPRTEPVDRPHRTQVAFFDLKNNKLVKRKAVNVRYQLAATAVPELVGEKCPDFIYANYGDYDYVKVELDPTSIATLNKHLSNIDDTLLRTMVWSNLFQMVEDAKLSLNDYVELVSKHMPEEKSIPTLKAILDTLHSRGPIGMDSLLYYYPAGEKRVEMLGRLEKAIWTRLEKAPAGADLQKILMNSYIKISESKEAQARLLSFLKKGSYKSTKIDQDQRWAMIKRLSQNGNAEAPALLATEKKKDTSEQGIKEAISAEVGAPDLKMKRAWLDKLTAGSTESLGRQKAAIQNLFPAAQTKIRTELLAHVLAQIPTLAQTRDQEFMSAWTEDVLPRYCEASSVEKIQNFLKDKGSKLPPAVGKPLRIHLQEDQRCLLIREKLAEQTPTKTGT